MNILVTGATGYIGSRLIPLLLDGGHSIRVLVRDKARIQKQRWSPSVEIVQGNLLEPDSLVGSFDGIDAAYYLVHSMGLVSDFEKADRLAASHFARAGVRLKLVVYLGGLQPQDQPSRSKHLTSRAEVGEILRRSLPTTEFRAGPIIGSGSASFDMIRYLTERLPIMVAPKWVKNQVQTIGIRDMLAFLIAALDKLPLGVVDVGSEPHSFKNLMKIYAELRGLRRIILPVPVLAPALAARWVGLVTPIPNSLAVPLIRGVIQPLVGDTTEARKQFPHIKPASYRDAVKLALKESLG